MVNNTVNNIRITIVGELEASILLTADKTDTRTDIDEANHEAKVLARNPDRDYTHLISIRGARTPYEDKLPGWEVFDDRPEQRLALRFDDVTFSTPMGYEPPTEQDVRKIINFAIQSEEDARAALPFDVLSLEQPMAPIHLLVHCAAGISRSSASAYLFLCAIRGPGSEAQNMADVYLARSFARPNGLMVELGDAILSSEHGHEKGAVYAAYETITRRRRDQGIR